MKKESLDILSLIKNSKNIYSFGPRDLCTKQT